MTPGPPCTLYEDIAELVRKDPLISDVAARIVWLRKRHKPVKRLRRHLKLAKAAEVAAA